MAAEATKEQLQKAEDILAQYLYCLGVGANGQWVTRRAMRYVRHHYFDTILNTVMGGTKWKRHAPYVLSYLRAIGALAAQLSLAHGRHCIEKDDMAKAIKKVENNYQKAPTALGQWCPPPEA